MAVLDSIRTQILAAFLLLSAIIAGLGAYGVMEIRADEARIKDLYDHPLMALNLARSASFVFSEMNNERLRRRLGLEPAASAAQRQDELSQEFFDDLKIASERILSPAAGGVIAEIATQAKTWESLRLAEGADAAADAKMDKLSSDIAQGFDRLIEYTVEDGFKQREKATASMARQSAISIAVAGLAFLFSGAVALLLARRILRPLSEAAAVANRVAGGDFQTRIPRGGRDETGQLLRSMAVMQSNIHEMMERESAERRSAQRRLVDAVDGSREGMILLSPDWLFIVVNSRVREFFPSIASAIVPGASFDAVFAAAAERPKGADDADAWLALLASNGEIELANGRWLRVAASTTSEGGRFLFLSDMTPIKEREESLRAARIAAEAASVAKTHFLANMGHELRTPLNAVIGFSEIIAEEQFGPVGSAQYREYAGDIANSGRHLLGIINDVLDLAQSTDGRLRLQRDVVDLQTLVEDCARIVGEQCRAAGLKLETTQEPGAWLVSGDESKLRKVVLNLLSNAIKFSAAGGAITMSQVTGPVGFIGISVTDRGIGMRREDIETALAPFGQIDSDLARRYEGTGLGLALARALTELHGGMLEIESELGAGTTVRVLLPGAVQISAGDSRLAQSA